MKSKTLCLMSLVLTCSIMQADEINTPVVKSDFSNLYLGLGISHMSLADDASDENFKAKGIALIAGYQLHQYVAVETRYTKDIGSVKYDHGSNNAQISNSNYPASFSNLGIYVKPMYQFDNITPYALLGYGKTKVTNIPEIGMYSIESGFQWGAGIQYSFNETISAFIDYLRAYDGKGFGYSAKDGNVVADFFTLGMTYKF